MKPLTTVTICQSKCDEKFLIKVALAVLSIQLLSYSFGIICPKAACQSDTLMPCDLILSQLITL